MSERPVLPDFTRYAWRSPDIKEWYAPLISEFSSAWNDIERLSVVEGLRDAAWVFVPVTELVSTVAWCEDHHLKCVPVTETHISSTYSNTGTGRGTPAFRCVLTRPKIHPLPFTDDTQVGKLLGYPDCCRKHFASTWGKGQVDSTWEQVAGTDWTKPTLASTLWRWMGVRLVFHMPCHYDCEASNRLAEQHASLLAKYGHHDSVALAKELFGMPQELSRVFGISEIVSPIVRILTRSDWTPTVERTAKGGTHQPLITSALWRDNGFTSATSMRAAHRELLAALIEHAPQDARVLDLGCGNALLLRRLKQRRPDVKLAGVDVNSVALTSIPPLTGQFWASAIEDLAWKDWNPSVVLINPVRLREMDPKDAEVVRGILARVPLLVVYCYSDLADQLEPLVAETQLGTVEMLTKLPHVTVGLIRRVE